MTDGAPDALLETGLYPGKVQIYDHRAVLQVVPLPRDRAEAEHRKLASLEGAFEPPERDLVDRAVGDVRLDAVALAQRAGELAQAVDALREHEDLLLAGDAGDRLGGDAAQQRQAVAAAPHGFGNQALLDERLRERGAAARQRLRVDGGVDEHVDVAQHDRLRA